MRRTAGYTWTDYKTNAKIAKDLKIIPILEKLLEYKRNWTQHVNWMPRNKLPRVMKYCSPTGRRNHGRTLKRLLVTWDWNGLTIGPAPWRIYDDDDDYGGNFFKFYFDGQLRGFCVGTKRSVVCIICVSTDVVRLQRQFCSPFVEGLLLISPFSEHAYQEHI